MAHLQPVAFSLRSILVASVLLGALFLAGCGQPQQGATPLAAKSASAPPPANLTPEQKKQYEEAQKSGPNSTAR